jgi:sortase A
MNSIGPYLVRIKDEPSRKSGRLVTWLRTFLLLVGLCGVGYYGYSLGNQYLYQAYQNWAFDQQIAGRPAVTVIDYLREQTPLGAVLRPATEEARSARSPVDQPADVVRPIAGALLGRVEIPRLNLSAMVREGVDADTLSHAVGHVPSTSFAGDRGNFAIAAHRDTLFRGLKDIHSGDTVIFETPKERYAYQVFSTKIVRPSEVSVLRPDGGFSSSTKGHLVEVANRSSRLLTMITCYPFYYVGSAPQRFIVQARLVSSEAREGQAD